MIPAADVILFASEGGLTQLRTADSHYWIERSLRHLEHRLDPYTFCRISRTAIVNVDAILQVSCRAAGLGEILLKQGGRLGVSRRRLAGLLRAIEGEELHAWCPCASSMRGQGDATTVSPAPDSLTRGGREADAPESSRAIRDDPSEAGVSPTGKDGRTRRRVSLAPATVLAALLALSAGCSSPSDPSTRTVDRGSWGARGALLTVEESGARLELDCAHGEVEGPLTLDRDNRFEETGVYVRARPGPVRPQDPPDSHPAAFSGRVDGRRMTLTVTPSDGVEGPGTLTLTLGAPGQLTKCL